MICLITFSERKYLKDDYTEEIAAILPVIDSTDSELRLIDECLRNSVEDSTTSKELLGVVNQETHFVAERDYKVEESNTSNQNEFPVSNEALLPVNDGYTATNSDLMERRSTMSKDASEQRKPSQILHGSNAETAKSTLRLSIVTCGECGRHFHSKHNLQRHLKNVHLVLKIDCSFCGKKFSRKESYLKHMLLHTTEKSYKCLACERKFQYSSSLRRHRKLHKGVKNFSCDICGQTFGRSDGLARHIQIHTTNRQYTCTICSKNYTRRDTLKRHILRSHPKYIRECNKIMSESKVQDIC